MVNFHGLTQLGGGMTSTLASALSCILFWDWSQATAVVSAETGVRARVQGSTPHLFLAGFQCIHRFGDGFVLKGYNSSFPRLAHKVPFCADYAVDAQRVLEVSEGCTLAPKLSLPQVQLIYMGPAKWPPLTVAFMIAASTIAAPSSSQSFRKGLTQNSYSHLVFCFENLCFSFASEKVISNANGHRKIYSFPP